MNEAEMANVMAVLHSAWNKGWDDDNVQFWWVRLREMDCALDDCVAAVKVLSDASKFRPEWSEFRAEVMRFKRDRKQHEDEARALATPPTDREREREAGRAGVALMRKAMARLAGLGNVNDSRGHNHKTDKPCPVCSLHDHTDKRTIGFGVSVMWRDTDHGRERVEHQEPIPAWHLTCPRCGGEFPDLVCDTWTPLGAQLMRDLKAKPVPSTDDQGEF